MRRRDFLLQAAGMAGAVAFNAHADHRVVSMNPSIIETDLATVHAQYTPADDFYVRNHFAQPAPAAAQLQIAGSVQRAAVFTMSDCAHLPRHAMGAVLECAGDPAATVCLVSNGLWEGWRLRDVAELSRPLPSASYMHFHGRDGFSRSVPIDDALRTGMLATKLNGIPLSLRHGAPWRVVFPGWYGMNAVKWLDTIHFAEAPLPQVGTTYTESRVGADGSVQSKSLPKMQVKSVIRTPAAQSVLRRGQISLDGLAWSGVGRIAGVEVASLAGGQWTAAKLAPSPGAYEWISWKATLPVNEVGPVTFACRAKDDQGNTQPAERDPQRLDYYVDNAYHRVRCIVAA